MSPVEIFGMLYRRENRSAWVPLPAPGGPKNTTFRGPAAWRANREGRRRDGSVETVNSGMGSLAGAAPAEALDHHLARFGERFLAVLGQNGEHARQECVLRRTEVAEDLVGDCRHAALRPTPGAAPVSVERQTM